MNSLYTLALRQSSSLSNDLALLSDSYSSPSSSSSGSSALHGQINASLAALDRTIEDYDTMARREIVEVKREKALSRVARFKDDYTSLRKQYDQIKSAGQTQKAQAERDSLLHSSSSALNSNPTSLSSSTSRARPPTSESPFTQINMGSTPPTPRYQTNFDGRTKSALDENSFLNSTANSLDAYISQGTAVLNNLAGQRDMLKGTKRRLLSAANTLGLSRSTIQYIERRTAGDFYILVGGGAVTIGVFVAILWYFG